MPDNEWLVIQAQSVETEAQRQAFFSELVCRNQAIAYRYAYSMLRDAQLAEDATQESFLVAYQLLSQLREPQAFSVWLQRILHTYCCRLLKEQKRFPYSLELYTEVTDEQPSPHASLEASELKQVVESSIESLPKSQQIPLTLYYLDNYSQREIAKILNLSLAAVKKRLERARNHLEERMRKMAQEYLQESTDEGGANPDLFKSLMDTAAEEGQFILLETLLVEGMDVNEQDANGQTVLHWAAREGHTEAISLLLSYHADATHRDKTGRTPLQLAIEGRHSEAVKRLRPYTPSK
jgi:RNA polymerase sigma-70 factor (ECF subfamily)